MLRLLGLFVTLVVFIGAVLAIDFNSARKEAAANEQPVPDFEAYLSGLRPRLLAKLSSARTKEVEPELSTDLAQMLPHPPAGWTVRSADSGDLAAHFPKSKDKIEFEVRTYIEDIARSKGPRGGTAAALTFEKGDQKVIVKAVRHPDNSFSDPVALKALLAEKPPFFQRSFLRVRGLDVQENTLPGEMRARLFTADLGAQIRIWILAPERMSDKDLLPFFETIDVRAMNAFVLDQEAGVGDLPVLFFASDLDEVTLAVYEADRIAKAAERDAQWAETLGSLVEIAPGATNGESAPEPASMTCSEGTGGIKRCKIGG